ncbi:hypothetical protein [Plantactinospora sp. CA-290183]|uniref:sialidase family protein n=1 Tax=Plantactinospora sp. CA-290183 TaxID=3240006 RepID=UPI003D9182F1
MSEREATALEVRLTDARHDLLESIDQPPLGRIRQRAAGHRRRRRRLRAGTGTALLGVAVAATLTAHPWSHAPEVSPPVADAASPDGALYTAAGITIDGLADRDVVAQVPGTISDVEFVDPDRGYLLARCATTDPCPATVARTTDGGLTWQYDKLPAATAEADRLDLIAFPDGRLTVTGDVGTYASADHGRSWRSTGAAGGTAPTPAAPGDLLRAGPGQRCRLDVEVWRAATGRAGTTAVRPDLDVCWVAPAAAPDGSWWAGGARNGTAAVAVTRDHGAHWRTVGLPGSVPVSGSVEVTGLGSQAYAAVLGADRSLLALYHSADGGRTFTRVGVGGPAPPAGLAGAAVPLLDGRLLTTGTDGRWYVSTDDGATFEVAAGSLPPVGRLVRTRAGYVAYDLFGTGWTAYSAEGTTWRKLRVS